MVRHRTSSRLIANLLSVQTELDGEARCLPRCYLGWEMLSAKTSGMLSGGLRLKVISGQSKKKRRGSSRLPHVCVLALSFLSYYHFFSSNVSRKSSLFLLSSGCPLFRSEVETAIYFLCFSVSILKDSHIWPSVYHVIRSRECRDARPIT